MRKPDPAPSSTSTAPRLPPSTTLSSNSLTPLANDTAGINPGATSSTSVGTTRKRKPVAQDRSDNEDYEPAAPVDKVASGSHKGVADYATGGLWAASYQSTQSKLKQNKSKPSPAATIPPLQPETDPSSRRRRPLPGSQGSHDRPRYVFADSDDDDDGDGDGAEEEDEYIPSTARRKSSGPGKAVGTGPPAPNSVRDGSDRRHSLAT
ncbi:hypothetical protein BOTBODRAFT_52642 [Botryobasidium botryosum FD-172 SS1]|uniref:Uncharacterized protein n=1 Tax=Botryobasidium botryosum (strain FD-172 SS1) TaxID=930990 RepID=A0A067MVH6_BOTB1|nr:hypothetical protein BOTBODRAFT_52642 [Botryobasidium botryosum FD-172 SS1]